MGEVVPFRQKPKPDFTEDVPPCDAAFCFPDCMGFAWALRADGCLECLGCLLVMDAFEWGPVAAPESPDET